MFVASTRRLAKMPLVNDLCYTKRYVRCLQISEVVNSMTDLIDYSRSTGEGPMESLAKFPRRTSTLSTQQGQNQHADEQQQQQSQQPLQQAIAQNSNNNNNNNDQGSSRVGQIQVALTNGVSGINNSFNGSSSTSHSTIAVLLHQNSMNSRQQNPMSNSNSPYGAGSSVQMPSPGSSSSMPLAQPNTPLGTQAGPTTNHVNSANSPSISNMQVCNSQPCLVMMILKAPFKSLFKK
ncbi:hypothetical protein RND81_01G163100 [Saponaria officinalis]|uniref:Uncharacterized protein n=1 Tax=Saponaria officinalis TaxID=3572 RepID=A0AAW1NFY6_SAPOF